MGVGFLLLAFASVACSPAYVVRGAWTEAGILYRREPITELLSDPATHQETKRKLQLVVDARAFAESIGLEPKGSYRQYSPVESEVLVWVLSGSPKLRLEPVTWWFPIVGRVPYKGFFEKSDAQKAARRLAEKQIDTYVRPSGAFSTLGWFEDPVLSTVLRLDDTALVDTVIHEILHTTLWIPNSVEFNETAAEFVGSRGALEFFLSRNSPLAEEVRKRRHDQLVFARFLEELAHRLKTVYESGEEKEVKLSRREAIFREAQEEWVKRSAECLSSRMQAARFTFNNAFIVAQRTYLDRPWMFDAFFDASGGTLPQFLSELKRLGDEVRRGKRDPYEVLAERTAELRGERAK